MTDFTPPAQPLRKLQGLINVIPEFEGGPEPLWYMTKGHVDLFDFQHELLVEYAVVAPVGNIEHVHLRNVPMGSGELGMMWMMLSKPGRGAYKATIFDCLKREVDIARKRNERRSND